MIEREQTEDAMPDEGEVVVVIPARYDSRRFPGKVLARICGRSMIEHVWRSVSAARNIDSVLVATDDERIAREVKNFGGSVVMTDKSIPSGSDRVAVVARSSGASIIVNVQADEPLTEPESIDDLILFMHREKRAEIATVVRPIKDPRELFDSNVVKAVIASGGRVLYFSRSLIPYHESPERLTRKMLKEDKFYAHAGIYAYRREALLRLTSLTPSFLEVRESLEQLRALENGMSVYAIVRDVNSIGVDLPTHIPIVEKRLRERGDE